MIPDDVETCEWRERLVAEPNDLPGAYGSTLMGVGSNPCDVSEQMAEAELRELDERRPPEPSRNGRRTGKATRQGSPNTAEQLVRLALERYRLGRTEKDEPFAVARNGPNLAVLFKGSALDLRARLACEYRRVTGRTPGASALAAALNVLVGQAMTLQPERVHLRIAAYGGGVVIDLGDSSGRAVAVRAGSWEIVERAPVLFRRTALTGALPVPETGGNLADLRRFLNIADDALSLLSGFLISSLVPEIPHPILLLGGLQGSGKSCAARLLLSLFDPSSVPLRSVPRDVHDWQVAASGSWGVAVDNVSRLTEWFSDALCRATTGDGLVKRALFSDADLAVLSFRRVVMLTSIDPGALRGDFGERLLLTDLEPIPDHRRRTEEEIEREFARHRPRLFGALLDALANVLATLPDVALERSPRMADFARLLAAADAAGVTRGALNLYRCQAGRIAAEVIDSDPFAAALVAFARERDSWEGTASDLLTAMVAPGGTIVDGWPKQASAVKGRLKRLIPALLSQGVRVAFDRDQTPQRRRLIRLAADLDNLWTTSGRPLDDVVQSADACF